MNTEQGMLNIELCNLTQLHHSMFPVQYSIFTK